MQILFARLFSRITPTEPTFGLVANEWLDSVSTCAKRSTYSVYSAIAAKYIPLGLLICLYTGLRLGEICAMKCGSYFIRGQVAQGAAHGAEDKGCGRRVGRAENPACIRFAQERALQPGSAGPGPPAGDGRVVPLRRRDLHTDRGGGQVPRPADVSKQVLRHAAARRGAQGQLPHAEAHLCHKLRGYGLRPQDPLRDTGSLRCEHHTQHICSPLRSS